MTLTSVKLNISTPTEPILPGRGFYQLEEESLFVQIGAFDRYHRFFSFLESSRVDFQLDRRGRLIFIEIDIPRRQWKVEPDLNPPDRIEAADIRWLNFRESINGPSVCTNRARNMMRLSFNGKRTNVLNYYLAQSVLVQTDETHQVTAIWITDIRDDKAGKKIAAFRKNLRANQPYFQSTDNRSQP